MGEKRMSRHVHRRLAAGLVTSALVAGGGALGGGSPASAAPTGSVSYSCNGLLGTLPLTDIPLNLSEAGDVSDGTIPIIGTLQTGQLSLVGTLLTSVTSAVDSLVLSNTPIPLRLEPVSGAVDSLLAGDGVPLVGSLPVPDPLPSDGIGLPSTLDLGSLVCSIPDGVQALLPLPGLPGGDTGGDTGGGTGGTTTTTHPTTPAPTHSTTTTHPAATKHATKRHKPNVRAKVVTKRVHHRKHPRVRVNVRYAGKPVAGSVIVLFRDRIVGHGHLRHGKIVLSLKRLARGKRVVTVVFQRTAKFKRTTKKVTFRIVK